MDIARAQNKSTLTANDVKQIKNTTKKIIKVALSLNQKAFVQYISPNYSSKANETIIDYTEFKSKIEKSFNKFTKQGFVFSLKGNITVEIIEETNKEVTVKTAYSTNTYNKKTKKRTILPRIRKITFAKENNKWKVTNWILLE